MTPRGGFAHLFRIGRIGRRTYWTYLGIEGAFWIGFGAIVDGSDVDLFDRGNRALAILALTAAAVSLIVGALIGIGRLHDRGRSGWWLALVALPFVGWAIAATLLHGPGTPGANRYGPGSRGRE